MASRKLDRHPAPRSATSRWVVVADAGALALFVLAGMRSHGDDPSFVVFFRNALPLLGAWFGFAVLLGTYRRRGLGVVLTTWIVAVPAGLVLRSLWVGSPRGARFLVFLGVGLAFTLLFLLAGRALVAVATGRGYIDRRRS
jgi:hypothetical protein